MAEGRWREGIVASGMGPALARHTFRAFDGRRQPVALGAARAFAADPRRWLLLMGSTGTGKTHLLCAVANQLIQEGRRPVYWLVADLVAWLQAGYSAGDFPDRLGRVKSCDVLLLDEYGLDLAEDDPARARARDRDEKMFMILNHRIGWELPVMLATNAKLAAFPPRIRSRLSDTALVDGIVMRPGDYRLER